MKQSPLVSVILPAYNSEEYITDAIESIRNQTYKNLEIIIIDDASTDETFNKTTEIAKNDKRIKVYRNEANLKIVDTLNKGIEQSRGVYIARMDSDDVRLPDSIKTQVDFLEKNPDVVVVGGAIDVCDKNLNFLNYRSYPRTDKDIRSKLFRYNPFAHPAIMMRKSALKHIKYELNWAEDYDLYFQLGRIGKFANLSETILRLRTHGMSVSQSKVSYQEYLTFYIRLKAVFEYGYKMTPQDKLYFFIQLITKFLMPVKFRFWLFNKVRKFF